MPTTTAIAPANNKNGPAANPTEAASGVTAVLINVSTIAGFFINANNPLTKPPTILKAVPKLETKTLPKNFVTFPAKPKALKNASIGEKVVISF